MRRLLPLTLVTGSLGAGKTSLLHHVISEQPGGHLAVLVESSGVLDLDGKALRGLCGAMRRQYDLVREVSVDDRLATDLREIAEAGRFERALVEVSATTLGSRWRRELQAVDGMRLEHIACVVDLLDFHQSLQAGKSKSGADPLLDFQRLQVREATLLILNKCDLASDADRQEVTRALRELNPAAVIIQTAYAEVSPELLLRSPTGAAEISRGEGPALESPGLESAVYRAFRPFHPQRFWDWFNEDHPGLLRVKGIAWLSTRNQFVGGISRTPRQNSCGAAGIWWAALPREEWPEDGAALQQILQTWRDPYGDRRQELLLIGKSPAAMTAARLLNTCLLNAQESSRPDWDRLPDPFPEWDLHHEE